MTGKPSPPPEAQLIRLVREAANMTIPAAAAAAGMSKSRWSQIEGGYESRRGSLRVIVAKAATIAHMAHTVGVTPERLTEAGRPDAAEILREILTPKPPPDGPRPEDDGNPMAVVRNWRELMDRLGRMMEEDPEAARKWMAETNENLRRLRESREQRDGPASHSA